MRAALGASFLKLLTVPPSEMIRSTNMSTSPPFFFNCMALVELGRLEGERRGQGEVKRGGEGEERGEVERGRGEEG